MKGLCPRYYACAHVSGFCLRSILTLWARGEKIENCWCEEETKGLSAPEQRAVYSQAAIGRRNRCPYRNRKALGSRGEIAKAVQIWWETRVLRPLASRGGAPEIAGLNVLNLKFRDENRRASQHSAIFRYQLEKAAIPKN